MVDISVYCWYYVLLLHKYTYLLSISYLSFNNCSIDCLAALSAFNSIVNPISPYHAQNTAITVRMNLKGTMDRRRDTNRRMENKNVTDGNMASSASETKTARMSNPTVMQKNDRSELALLSPPATIPMASISRGRFGSHCWLVCVECGTFLHYLLACLLSSSILNRARRPTWSE